MKHYLRIFILSLVAIFVHGYQFATSDQEIFIPYILRSQNPSLFQGDILFDQISAKTSIFYNLAAAISKVTNIETVFFVGYVIFQFAFFLSIYRLSRVLLNDHRLAYLSIMPFILPKFIGGTATLTFDTFFGYRSIGVIFLVLYLSFLIKGAIKQSILSALAGLIFHPLSIIPNIALLPLAIYIKKQKKPGALKQVVTCCLAFFTTTLIMLAIYSYFGLLQDDLWLMIIKFRDNYLFASLWGFRAWASLALYLFLLYTFLQKSEHKKMIILFTIVSLFIFLLYFVCLEILRIPHIARMQLLRSLSPTAYIALAASPALLIFKDKVLKILGGICFILLCLNQFNLLMPAAIIFSFTLFMKKSKIQTTRSTVSFINLIFAVSITASLFFKKAIEYPKKENDWIQLQKWALNNTKVTDTFLVPPTRTGFRIFSNRPIVGDIKDGAVVIYSSYFAKNWYERISNIGDINILTESEVTRLGKIYNFDFVVTSTRKQLNFEKAYQNNSYLIYKL